MAAALLPCTPGYITLVDGIGQITTFYLQSTGMIIYPLSQPVITAGPTDVTWASGQPINYVTPNPSVAVATVAAQFTVPAVVVGNSAVDLAVFRRGESVRAHQRTVLQHQPGPGHADDNRRQHAADD